MNSFCPSHKTENVGALAWRRTVIDSDLEAEDSFFEEAVAEAVDLVRLVEASVPEECRQESRAPCPEKLERLDRFLARGRPISA